MRQGGNARRVRVVHKGVGNASEHLKEYGRYSGLK